MNEINEDGYDFPLIPANQNGLSRRKLIYGVGINDSPYKINLKVDGKTKQDPIYLKWIKILQHCYDEKYQEKYPSSIGYSVTTEWLTFSNFKKWMLQQENWQESIVDKDLKIKGNKTYCADTCLMLPRKLNGFITSSILKANKKSGLPTGVTPNKNKFQAKAINPFNPDSSSHIGLYPSIEEASRAYQIRKNEHIRQMAIEYPEYAEYILRFIYK